ncbi:hypothetical protein NHQ30_002823 [Ciborinia camelliae]|nr:hypothetical protein NHQ30_002823 [Ciborinia camelliae]
MPPKKSSTTLGDPPTNPTHLTLLLKHTSHTVLLLVPSKQTFTEIIDTLLTVLRERYPDGLSAMPSSSSSPPPRTSTTTLSSTTTTLTDAKIPLPDSVQDIALAVPIDEYEPQNGWTELELGLGDSPASIGLKEGAILAFRFLKDGEDDTGLGEFEVRWPSYEDIYGDGEEDEERTLGGGGEVEEEAEEDEDEDEL